MLTEDRELDALLALDLMGLETLGLGDPAFPPPPLEKTSIPVLPKVTFPGGDAKPAQYKAFHQSLVRVTARTLTQKATLIKDHLAKVEKTQESYDQICLGEMQALRNFSEIAEFIQEKFRQDANGMLALSLAPISNPNLYPYFHAVNVSILTMATATAAGLTRAAVLEAGLAALVADVGMRLVPDEILNKQGRLTDEEMALIHQHPGYSRELLKSQEGVTPLVLQVAHQHHERQTGGGYPQRLTTNQILPEARMFAIADTLAAMVHKRSHRNALTPYEALERVIKMGQMNLLEWNLLKGLVGYISLYPLGTLVDLGGERIGRVVEAHPEDPARPIVSVIKAAGVALGLNAVYRIDLKTSKDVKIQSCLSPENSGFRPLDGF